MIRFLKPIGEARPEQGSDSALLSQGMPTMRSHLMEHRCDQIDYGVDILGFRFAQLHRSGSDFRLRHLTDESLQERPRALQVPLLRACHSPQAASTTPISNTTMATVHRVTRPFPHFLSPVTTPRTKRPAGTKAIRAMTETINVSASRNGALVINGWRSRKAINPANNMLTWKSNPAPAT